MHSLTVPHLHYHLYMGCGLWFITTMYAIRQLCPSFICIGCSRHSHYGSVTHVGIVAIYDIPDIRHAQYTPDIRLIYVNISDIRHIFV